MAAVVAEVSLATRAFNIFNLLLLAGMGVGAGVAGYNNAENSCNAVKNAVSTLKKAKALQDQWRDALANVEALDIATVQKITDNYTQIEILQNSIIEAQAHAKKTKAIVVSLGLSVIIVLFFYLLYRYFNKKIKYENALLHKHK